MKEHNEFIKSLERMISSKKSELGVDSEICEIKGLMKYANFEDVEVPKKSDGNKIARVFALGVVEGFQKAVYTSYKHYTKEMYIFERMLSEVSKKVAGDMNNILGCENAENAINTYISDKTVFRNISIEFLDKSMVNSEEFDLVEEVFEDLKKSDLKMAILRNKNEKTTVNNSYTVLNSKLKPKMIGEWKRISSSTKVHVRDFTLLIAIGRIVKDCQEYFSKDVNRSKKILAQKLYPNRVFEEQLSNEDIVQKIKDLDVGSIVEEAYLNRLPLSLISLYIHCMSEIILDTGAIVEYKNSILSSDSEYAKPYMTKKNITKKAENYMSNNKFLNMFDYVEIDNSCDIDKLKLLEDEFVKISSVINLPVIKGQSLRFRKLGNIKASGAYYYAFKSVCIDLNGIYSFIHEMFHMVDYAEGLISLDGDFKELADAYKESVESSIKQLPKEHGVYKMWNSKNKINKDYYLKRKEIFARLGEIYVIEELGLRSSFNNVDLDEGISKYVYPRDSRILVMVKDYYDKLFEIVSLKYGSVSFLDSEREPKNSLLVDKKVEVEIEIESECKIQEHEDIVLSYRDDVGQLSFF